MCNTDGLAKLQSTLKCINPTLGLCSVPTDTPPTIPTKLQCLVPMGSVLSSHLSLTEGNFDVICDISSGKVVSPTLIPKVYPDFPFGTVPLFNINQPLTQDDYKFISTLQLTADQAIRLEIETRGQSNNTKWFEARRNRLTCSNFGLVYKRKANLNHSKFVENNIIKSRDISHVPAVRYIWIRQ